MENWSFPDHKSDFKADQKIRKAMFLEKRKVVQDLGGASRRDRILLTFPFGPGEQVSFLFSTLLAVNPGTLDSERFDLAIKAWGRGGGVRNRVYNDIHLH